MAYKEMTNRNSPNFTAGRGGKKIDKIIIHWWGDPATNPSTIGVVNVLCNPARQASAHFVASGTNREVYQIVNDSDTAWHAGDWNANQTSLGVECDPRCRDEDYDVIAELIADLWKYYGKLPLFPHNKYSPTQCPGNYDLGRLARLAEEKLNPKPIEPPKPSVPTWVPMDNPRSMVAAVNTQVTNLVTGGKEGTSIGAGTQIDNLVDKTTWNGVQYVRTKYSQGKGFNWGIKLSDLKEIPVDPQPPVEPPVNPSTGFTDKDRDTLNEVKNNTNAIIVILNQIVAWFKQIFNVK